MTRSFFSMQIIGMMGCTVEEAAYAIDEFSRGGFR